MNKELENQWFEWAKRNRKKIVKEIILKYDKEDYKAKQIIFLSGSPWAWKTEFINWMLDKWFSKYFLHIDLDDLRKLIPWYKWEEADSFQKWAIKIMEFLLDKAFEKELNIILDWTFWSKSATNKNIDKAKRKWYDMQIYYIKFDPILAWKYTLWREIDKKRKIPIRSFYRQYYNSFKNIKRIIEKNPNIELIVLDKVLTKSWHSAKIYTIRSYKDFKKIEKKIKPNWNKIIIFIKLILLLIKYRFLIKKGLINYKKDYE
jgi:UDP-N-acetylglucosamine kinase